MNAYVKTHTILDRILERKVEEVEAAKGAKPLTQLQAEAQVSPPARDFLAALHRDTVALIAEIKKASPSKGVLTSNFDPVAIAQTYANNGAAAISVLTDQDFFQGHLDYLRMVRAAVNVPILRKDFIIDPYQIYEARAAGADAVLLIVMALEDAQLSELNTMAKELGMMALVEVHNEAELERALNMDADLIGVNNRDLKNFVEDLNTAARLAEHIPAAVTWVAESAIRTTADVSRMGALGARAVLVGESLMKSDNMALQVREFSRQPRG